MNCAIFRCKGAAWGSPGHLFHPFLGILAHPRSQIFPQTCQCSHFFHHSLEGSSSRKRLGILNLAENSTNTYSESVSRLSLKATLFYLLFFTPLQVPGRCARQKSSSKVPDFPPNFLFFFFFK